MTSAPDPAKLEHQIARSLDLPPGLLPFAGELFAEFRELGCSVPEVLQCVAPLELPSGPKALDLGSGKGAASLALAEAFGFRMVGIEAYEPFVREAESLARQRGLDRRCRFECGDLHAALERGGSFDLALLLGVGAVTGPPQVAIDGLRRCVRPGGWMVIDDAFLACADEGHESTEGYRSRAETEAGLTRFGDRLERTWLPSEVLVSELNARNNEALERATEDLRSRRPDLGEMLDQFLQNQHEESDRMEDELQCALWVLQRGD